MYAIDREENTELATIDALIEAGLICVFPNKEGAEIRGYGRKIQVRARHHDRMPVTRDVALRIVQEIVRENRRKIREREDRAIQARLAEDTVESRHD